MQSQRSPPNPCCGDKCQRLPIGPSDVSGALTAATVDEVVFGLSSVTGIVQGDFANLEIYVDDDNDGTIEAGTSNITFFTV